MQGALHAYAWLIGILWGVTNPLVRRGSLEACCRKNCSPWVAHLTTPAFIIPQVLNQAGSALFIYLLGVSGMLTTSLNLCLHGAGMTDMVT